MHDRALRAALASCLDTNFERLVRRYQDGVYRFALRLTGSPPDAEEVAQDTFVRAYRALARYPRGRVGSLCLRPWLYRIALNVVRNRVRQPRLRLVSLDASEPRLAADPGMRPEAVWERTEGARALRGLLAALPVRYRAAVVLRHVEGLPYRELATALGQPVGTVKANVYRGTRLLRQALAARAREGR